MVACIQLPEVGLSCFNHVRVIAFFLAVKSTPARYLLSAITISGYTKPKYNNVLSRGMSLLKIYIQRPSVFPSSILGLPKIYDNGLLHYIQFCQHFVEILLGRFFTGVLKYLILFFQLYSIQFNELVNLHRNVHLFDYCSSVKIILHSVLHFSLI